MSTIFDIRNPEETCHYKFSISPKKCHCTAVWNSGLLLLSACYRNMIIIFFIKKYRQQTKTAKLTDLLSVFFTTFSFCVIFIVEVYTVLIKVYCFLWGEKWVAQKTVSCWIAWKMVSQTTSQVLFEMTIVCLNTSFESSNLVRHWSMASSTTLCWNSRHVSTIRCRNSTFLHFTRESGDIVEVKWAYL